MAEQKITELTEATSMSETDLFPIVSDPNGDAQTKKITRENVLKDYAKMYSVKSYGAAGDGETDDTEAIKDAVADVKTAGGGTVFFPDGTYIISEEILVTSDYTRFIGNGAGKSIIKLADGANCDMFDVSAVSRTGFSDLEFDGNKANQTSNVDIITSNDSESDYEEYLYIRDCAFKNAKYHALDISGTLRYWIEGNTFIDGGYAPVRLHSGDGCKFTNNIVYALGSSYCGLFIDGRNNLIDGNTIYVDAASVPCIMFSSDGTYEVRGNKIVNNTFVGSSKVGYGISITGDYNFSNVIANNYFYDMNICVSLSTSSNVWANNVMRTINRGFSIGSTANTGTVITGNHIEDFAYGIRCYSSVVNITGNLFKNGTVGIKEETGADYNIILGNILSSVDTDITVVGGHTVNEHNIAF
jgi:hypothetical protein